MKKQFFILALVISASIEMIAQSNKNVTIPLIGDDAPSFTGISTYGKIDFPKDFGRNWKIIFAHPKDFTPVCSSELLELAQQQADYKSLGVQIIVISTDIISQHNDWVKSLNEIKYKDRQPVRIEFPLVADSTHVISNKYGMIHSSASIALNIRAVFIIDPSNKIRSINFYPMQVGRNMDEIKRVVVALQTIDAQKNVSTPANWKPGDSMLVPVLTQSERENIGKPNSDINQVAWFMNFRLNK